MQGFLQNLTLSIPSTAYAVLRLLSRVGDRAILSEEKVDRLRDLLVTKSRHYINVIPVIESDDEDNYDPGDRDSDEEDEDDDRRR